MTVPRSSTRSVMSYTPPMQPSPPNPRLDGSAPGIAPSFTRSGPLTVGRWRSPAAPNVSAQVVPDSAAATAQSPATPRKERGRLNRTQDRPSSAPAGESAREGAPALDQTDYLNLILLIAAALALYVTRLSTPPRYIYDEVYHAYTAAQYVAGNADAYLWSTTAPRPGVAYEWTHPPLGKLLIAGGVFVFGDNSFGWRIIPAVFGAIGLAVVYLLGLRLTHQRLVAGLAAGLLLVDGLYFVQSRTGMLDIFGTVLMLGALLALHRYLTAPPDRVRGPLLGLGLLLGLAIATKWNAAYAATLVGLIVLGHLLRLGWITRQEGTTTEARAGFREHLVWVPVGLAAVPLAVYLLSYVPFFATGQGWSQFVELQRQMYSYHSNLDATHPYQSWWWQWPLTLRPVWYAGGGSDGMVANTYANGNPFLYWAFLPAVFSVGVRWWGTRPAALTVLLIGFFGQWLPWMLSPRIAFVYHFLPVVPFGCLAVAVIVAQLWRGGRVGQAVSVAYVAVVVLAFAFFYPIYSFLPLSPEGFNLRIWLESWR